VGRDADRLAQVADEHRGRVAVLQVDLASQRQVDALVRELPLAHPDLSVVVNNAAVQTETDFLGDEALALVPLLRQEIEINFGAVVALSVGFLPHLRRQERGAIVNLTSALALAPKKAAPVYCATKAAVRSFSRALRYQCQDAAPHVRVVDVVMELVDTDMTRGRGSGKISPEQAARKVIDALCRGPDEAFVGRSKLVRRIMRIAPRLGERVMRDL
jgi:uncharacterized oxidoreductase